MKNVILVNSSLHEVRFNPHEVGFASHLSDSSFLDIFHIWKKCVLYIVGVVNTIAKLAKACTLRLTADKLYFILSERVTNGGVSIWCELAQVIYFNFITARKRSLRRLCFYRCLSVHRGGVSVGACMVGVLHGSGVCVLCMPPPASRYYGIRSMSRWYASYWNAFLFLYRVLQKKYTGWP